jgi:hypothetical protein
VRKRKPKALSPREARKLELQKYLDKLLRTGERTASLDSKPASK